MSARRPPLPAGRTLLDAAMGTSLRARGLPQDALPEEWVLARPDEVRAVHAEHAAAGAAVLLTCTFNLAAPRLEARLDPAAIARVAPAAVRLAREAAPGAVVAGGLGPTLLAAPGRTADGAALRARYLAAAEALAAAGADALWIESQLAPDEARAALSAARATGLPAAVTFTFRELGPALRAFDGTPAEACLAAAAADGAFAAGASCVFPGPALTALARWAKDALPVPLALKPSPGLPGAVAAPDAFAVALAPALLGSETLAGACCGGTGAHLRALRPVLDG
ncbi:MAG TPA: homocysteine S-methyltransferase family protein [Anaeromyxobacter sp.]|nr:homocysteine S-methyltransferase family protein [Anaeromyxobacter sp.]